MITKKSTKPKIKNNIIDRASKVGVLSGSRLPTAQYLSDELSKLGFKKAIIDDFSIDPNKKVFDDLTIIFKPYVTHNYSILNYTGEYSNHLRTLSGVDSIYDFTTLNENVIKGQIRLEFEYGGQTLNMGHYLPDRNVVLFYLSSAFDNWSGDANPYIKEIIECIKTLAKNYKFESIDAEKTKEMLLVNRFQINVERNISDIRTRLINNRSHIKEYEMKIPQWYSSNIADELAVEKLQESKEGMAKVIFKNVKEIQGLKFVKKCELTEQGIEIAFDRVFITHNKVKVDMGNYIITLLADQIRIINDDPLGNYYGPHITKSSICFGHSKKIPYSLLGKLELKQLVSFLYLFVKTYNNDNPYHSMDNWSDRQVQRNQEAKIVKSKDPIVQNLAMANASSDPLDRIFVDAVQEDAPGAIMESLIAQPRPTRIGEIV